MNQSEELVTATVDKFKHYVYARVNGSHYLAKDPDAAKYIGRLVKIIRIQKNGLYRVCCAANKNNQYSFAKYNLNMKYIARGSW